MRRGRRSEARFAIGSKHVGSSYERPFERPSRRPSCSGGFCVSAPLRCHFTIHSRRIKLCLNALDTAARTPSSATMFPPFSPCNPGARWDVAIPCCATHYPSTTKRCFHLGCHLSQSIEAALMVRAACIGEMQRRGTCDACGQRAVRWPTDQQRTLTR
jgi:hypothetical protein